MVKPRKQVQNRAAGDPRSGSGARGPREASALRITAMAVGAFLVLLLLVRVQRPPVNAPDGPLGPDSPRDRIIAAARAGRISSQWRGGETAPILDAAQFRGQTFMGLDVEAGYRAAAEIPDVLDELFCYCFCEDPVHSPAHKSLRSCFTDLHASQCVVCQKEVMRARELVRQGVPLPKIERAIDAEFSRA